MAASLPLQATATGVRVRVRVMPRPGPSAIKGVVAEGPVGPQLQVRVGAVPEAGKANAALVKLLAKAWRVPSARLAIVAGHASRSKVIAVEGETAALMAALTEWFLGFERSEGGS